MSKIQGSHLLLGRVADNGIFSSFAYSKSCEITQQRDTIEVSSPTSGLWREYRAGRCSRSITCECLLASDETEIESLFRDGTPILVSCRNRDNTGYEYRGRAIITHLHLAGRLHEMASYSITLQGTGAMAYAPVV